MNDMPAFAEDPSGSPIVWEGANCAVAAPGERLIFDESAWKALWEESFAREAPRVDFEKYFALAVFAGSRPTGGFGVDFLAPRKAGGAVELAYAVRAPSPSAFVIQAFTQPYAVRLYTKTRLPVRVKR